MNKIGKKFFILIALPLLAISCATYAQDSTEYELLEPLPFVGDSSGVTTANEYIPGIVQLTIAIAGALAVIKIVFGGIQYMSTDAFQKKNDAKGTISNAIWGLLLIISAWLILYTVNPNLVNFDFSIEGQEVGDAFDTGLGGAPSVSDDDCVDCVVVSVAHKRAPVGCAPTGEEKVCKVNPELNQKLINLRTKLREEGITSYMWQVTESFPPTREHKAQCHYNGTCVDANFVGFPSSENIGKFINEANVVGLRAVYEVRTEERAEQVKRSVGSFTSQVIVVPEITGEHFSVYLR